MLYTCHVEYAPGAFEDSEDGLEMSKAVEADSMVEAIEHFKLEMMTVESQVENYVNPMFLIIHEGICQEVCADDDVAAWN